MKWLRGLTMVLEMLVLTFPFLEMLVLTFPLPSIFLFSGAKKRCLVCVTSIHIHESVLLMDFLSF